MATPGWTHCSLSGNVKLQGRLLAAEPAAGDGALPEHAGTFELDKDGLTIEHVALVSLRSSPTQGQILRDLVSGADILALDGPAPSSSPEPAAPRTKVTLLSPLWTRAKYEETCSKQAELFSKSYNVLLDGDNFPPPRFEASKLPTIANLSMASPAFGALDSPSIQRILLSPLLSPQRRAQSQGSDISVPPLALPLPRARGRSISKPSPTRHADAVETAQSSALGALVGPAYFDKETAEARTASLAQIERSSASVRATEMAKEILVLRKAHEVFVKRLRHETEVLEARAKIVSTAASVGSTVRVEGFVESRSASRNGASSRSRDRGGSRDPSPLGLDSHHGILQLDEDVEADVDDSQRRGRGGWRNSRTPGSSQSREPQRERQSRSRETSRSRDIDTKRDTEMSRRMMARDDEEDDRRGRSRSRPRDSRGRGSRERSVPSSKDVSPLPPPKQSEPAKSTSTLAPPAPTVPAQRTPSPVFALNVPHNLSAIQETEETPSTLGHGGNVASTTPAEEREKRGAELRATKSDESAKNAFLEDDDDVEEAMFDLDEDIRSHTNSENTTEEELDLEGAAKRRAEKAQAIAAAAAAKTASRGKGKRSSDTSDAGSSPPAVFSKSPVRPLVGSFKSASVRPATTGFSTSYAHLLDAAAQRQANQEANRAAKFAKLYPEHQKDKLDSFPGSPPDTQHPTTTTAREDARDALLNMGEKHTPERVRQAGERKIRDVLALDAPSHRAQKGRKKAPLVDEDKNEEASEEDNNQEEDGGRTYVNETDFATAAAGDVVGSLPISMSFARRRRAESSFEPDPERTSGATAATSLLVGGAGPLAVKNSEVIRRSRLAGSRGGAQDGPGSEETLKQVAEEDEGLTPLDFSKSPTSPRRANFAPATTSALSQSLRAPTFFPTEQRELQERQRAQESEEEKERRRREKDAAFLSPHEWQQSLVREEDVLGTRPDH